MAKCPSCGFEFVEGASKFKCTARELPQYKDVTDSFCVFHVNGDCIEPETRKCQHKVKKPDDEVEYASIEDMVKNCPPEQLKKLQEAFNNYLKKNGLKPIPFVERS